MFFKTYKMKLLKILFILLFFSATTLQSQNEKKQTIITKALTKDNLKNQFETLIEKSPTFQGFNNLRFGNVRKFKTNLFDTLKAFDNKYKIANTKIKEQRLEIEKLNTNITSINTSLSDITKEKDSINVFGIRTTKTTYNTVLWSIILSLLMTTLVFLFKFKSSNKTTKDTKNLYTEIENEFETHRKNSLEREQVLRRKLQDEINKQRNA